MVEPRQLEYFVTVAEESQAGNVPVWETVTVASDPTSATASAVPRSRAAGAVKVVTGAVVRTGMSAESLTGRSGCGSPRLLFRPLGKADHRREPQVAGEVERARDVVDDACGHPRLGECCCPVRGWEGREAVFELLTQPSVSGARPPRRWWRTSGRQRPRLLGVPRTVPRTGGRCLWPAQGHRRRTAPVRRAPEAVRDSGAHNAQLLRSQRLDGVIYLSGAGASPSALLELTTFRAAAQS